MSHKRMKVQGSMGVQLSLIITPMLDMSFQILAFFIMTYHPAAMEGHIPGNLTPPEDFAKKSKDQVAAPTDPLSIDEDKLDPSLNDAVTVQIKAVMEGQSTKRIVGTPGQVFLRTNLDVAPELLEGSDTGDFQEAVLPLLEKRLKQMASKGNKANLKIAGDATLRYQYLLMAYDTAKKAGFEKIHFVPPQIKSKMKLSP